MRLDTARKFALSLPETTEEPHFDLSSFRVRKKIFSTFDPAGEWMRIHVDPEEGVALIATNPLVFRPVVWGKRVVPYFVEVVLAAADRREVCELLEEAWRLKAPPRVLKEFDARITPRS